MNMQISFPNDKRYNAAYKGFNIEADSLPSA